MSSYTFTVTSVDYIFTATVSNPAELTLASSPDNVSVTNTVNTVTVSRVNQPVIVQLVGSGGTGNPFNQTLNTYDDVEFASITVNNINGPGPVNFPSGISTENIGTTFNGPVDFSTPATTLTNQLALLFFFAPVDFGTVLEPTPAIVNFGSI